MEVIILSFIGNDRQNFLIVKKIVSDFFGKIADLKNRTLIYWGKK